MTKSKELAPFWDHVEELRKTLIHVLLIIATGFAIAFFFQKPLTGALLATTGQELALFSPIEGIGIILKLSLWVGIVTSSPFWLYRILLFVAPALSQRGQSLIFPFLSLSLLFLLFGFTVSYYFTIPFANSYLGSLNSELGKNVWGLANYLDYTLFLMLSNGLVFESALLLVLLVHFGILTAEAMAEKRRFFIVAAFIASAILTPPDVLTQAMMALPLIALYECAILYSHFRTQMRSRLSCSSK